MPKEIRKPLLDVRASQSATLDTDHFLLVMNMKLYLQRGRKQWQNGFHLDKPRLKDKNVKRTLNKEFEKDYS